MDKNEESRAKFEGSNLYKRFLSEREEILKYKWIESEKKGEDIGFDQALLSWTKKHRKEWKSTTSEDVKPNTDSEYVLAKEKVVALVVEDDYFNQNFLTEFLSDFGVTVDIASSHLEAMAKIKNRQYDVLVVDIHLTRGEKNLKREGLQVIRDTCDILQQNVDPTIIALSGDPHALVQEMAFEAGADYFLKKPMEIGELIKVLCERGILRRVA